MKLNNYTSSITLYRNALEAMLNFLTLKPGSPHVTVVDLVGGAPTFVNTDASATDLLIILQAFAGSEYPPAVLLNEGYPGLLGGASLAAAAEVTRQGGAQGIMINCVTLAVANKAVKALAETTTLPFGVYANAGRSQPSREGVIRQRHSDGNFVAAAREWITSGASLIGGCCGTTPNTIRALNRLLASP